MSKQTYKVGEREITVYRANNDVNGNPRYIVHYLSLDLPDYVSTPKTRQAGLKIYRGKDFGGGFIFQSYHVQNSLERIIRVLHEG